MDPSGAWVELRRRCRLNYKFSVLQMKLGVHRLDEGSSSTPCLWLAEDATGQLALLQVLTDLRITLYSLEAISRMQLAATEDINRILYAPDSCRVAIRVRDALYHSSGEHDPMVACYVLHSSASSLQHPF
jgi:hypothetical protein